MLLLTTTGRNSGAKRGFICAGELMWDTARATLVVWFIRLPAPARAQMRERFADANRAAHLGEFWELLGGDVLGARELRLSAGQRDVIDRARIVICQCGVAQRVAAP